MIAVTLAASSSPCAIESAQTDQNLGGLCFDLSMTAREGSEEKEVVFCRQHGRRFAQNRADNNSTYRTSCEAAA
jgi:hypothetical protein